MEKWAKSELDIDAADTLWEAQMGITLHNFGFYQESIDRCIASRNLDASNWRASYIQAESCWERDDTKASLELIMPVMERFRNEEALRIEYEEKFYLGVLASYGVWNTDIKEYDKATAAFQEIHEHDMDQYAPIYWTLELLEKQEKYTAIIETLQDLQGKKNSKGQNRLTAMHHQYANKDEYFTRLNTAGFHSSSMDVVRDSMYEALAPENVVGVIPYVTSWLNYFLANLLYTYPRTDADKAEAVKIWAHIVNKSARKIYLVSEADILEATTEKLGEIYLHQAIDAGVDTPAAEEYLKKLMDLRPSAKDGTTFFTCQNLQFMIARLQHLMGQKEKAMDTLRGHVKVALDLLCDDDDSNDWDAYLRLTSVAHVDDDVNTLAAWSALGPFVHTEETEEKEVEEEAEGEAEDKVDETEERSDAGNIENGGCKDQTDVGAKVEIPILTGLTSEDAENLKSAEITEIEVEAVDVTVVAGVAEIKVAEAEVENGDGEEGKESMDENEEQEDKNQTEEVGAEEGGDGDEEDENLSGPLELSCDGDCGREWTWASEFHACKDCLDVQFCNDCYNEMKNNGKEMRLCGRNHSFVFVPYCDADTARQVPKGSIRVGNEIIPVHEWVERLRAQWGILEEKVDEEKPKEEASS